MLGRRVPVELLQLVGHAVDRQTPGARRNVRAHGREFVGRTGVDDGQVRARVIVEVETREKIRTDPDDLFSAEIDRALLLRLRAERRRESSEPEEKQAGEQPEVAYLDQSRTSFWGIRGHYRLQERKAGTPGIAGNSQTFSPARSLPPRQRGGADGARKRRPKASAEPDRRSGPYFALSGSRASDAKGRFEWRNRSICRSFRCGTRCSSPAWVCR